MVNVGKAAASGTIRLVGSTSRRIIKMRFTPFPQGISSSHHNLLHAHAVAVDQAQHVDAGGRVDGLRRGAADAVVAQDVAQHVDHLQRRVAFVVDHPHAVAVEREGSFAVLFAVVTGSEHDLEAALVVRRLGVEGVGR